MVLPKQPLNAESFCGQGWCLVAKSQRGSAFSNRRPHLERVARTATGNNDAWSGGHGTDDVVVVRPVHTEDGKRIHVRHGQYRKGELCQCRHVKQGKGSEGEAAQLSRVVSCWRLACRGSPHVDVYRHDWEKKGSWCTWGSVLAT